MGFPRRVMALLAPLMAAACSTTTTSTNTFYGLTQDQINLIVPVITSAAVGPMLAVLPAQPSAGRAAPQPTAVNIPIDSTTPCPVSGAIRMSGAVTGDAAQAGTLSVGGPETVAQCAIRANTATDTTVYTVSSLPSLTAFGLVRYGTAAPNASQTFYIQGSIQILNSLGQQALCNVDLIVTADLPSHTARVTGNICFIGVDTPATWGSP